MHNINWWNQKYANKDAIWFSPMTKANYTHRKLQKANLVTTQELHKKLQLHNDCGPSIFVL